MAALGLENFFMLLASASLNLLFFVCILILIIRTKKLYTLKFFSFSILESN